MNNNQGALYFGAGIDMTQWRQNVNEIRRDILGLNTTTQQQTKAMDSSFKSLALAVGTYFSGAALGNFANQIINVRGEFQKTEIAFETMLGSQEKAQALMAQMVDLAAKTPFSLKDVADGAKQLLAFQIPADQVVDTLTRMGNIAAGLGVPLSRINLVYGQVMAKGKLMGDDLRQFTEAGIPMVAELAKKFGTTTAAINKMVSDGKVGFNDVKDVLFSLTSEGGMFFNLMEKQSKSLSGQMANLGDAWDQMLNKIGEKNEGFLSSGIQEAIYLVENYEGVIDVIEGLIVTYGAYRAAIIVNSVALRVAAQQEAGLTLAQIARAAATRGLTTAQALLNSTMLANPYVLVTTLLAGLTVALYKMSSQVSYAVELQKKHSEKMNEASSNVQAHKAKVDALVTAIRSENTTNEQRKALHAQLITLSNGRLGQLTVEEIRTGKATKAINEYINALDREARAKAVVDLKAENYKRRLELQNNKKPTFGETASTIVDSNTYKDKSGNVTAASVWRGLTEKSIESYNRNKEAEKRAIDAKDKEYDAFLQKNAADLVETVTDTGTQTAGAINNNTEKVKKSNERHKAEVEKIYGEDTIRGLQQRIQKLSEKIDITSSTDANLDKLVKQREELDKKLAEAQKRISKQSFDEEITELERQWKVKYAIAKYYGQEVADAQFPQLKGSYYKDISEKFRLLNEKMQEGKLSDDEISQWEKLRDIINSLTGIKDPLSNFNDGIDVALRKLPSLTAQIEYLTNLRDSQTDEGTSQGFYAAAADRLEAKLTEQRNIFNQILEDQKSFEERSLALQKEYDSMRALAKTDAEREKIDKAFSKKATDLFFDQMSNSEEWVKVFTDMNLVATTKLEEFKRILQTKLSEAKTIEEKIKIGEFIKKIDDTISQRNPFVEIKKAIEAMGNESLSAEEKMELLIRGIDAANNYLNILQSTVNVVESTIETLGISTENAMGDVLYGIRETIAGVKQALEGFKELKESQRAYLEAKDAGSAFGQVMSGLGMVGAAVKIVGAAINSVSGWISGDNKKERAIKRQAAALKELETRYNELAFAAERAFGAAKYDGQRDLIRNLEQQKIAIEAMMRTESSKKKADKGKIADYKAQITQINQSITELKEGIISDVLQTEIPDMAAKIGDALLDAFGKGEDGVKAVNAAFDDMVKNIMRNQLNKVLEAQMKPIYANMLKAAGFNSDGTGAFDGFTEAELKDLREQYLNASKIGQEFIKGYSEIFKDLQSPDVQGIKGDIKGVTEKTAGALEAQINALRVNQVSGLEVMRNSLLNLVRIEENTRRLHNIDKNIQELNAKTKNNLAGVG